MITTALDLDIDQQQREIQAAMVAKRTAFGIAEELFIDGEADGYCDGVRPASSDLAYLAGYSQGLRRKMADIQRNAELLEAEGLAVEATVEALFGEEIPF